MDRIREAIISDAPAEEFASIPVPESYRAVTVHKDEADMFAGLPTNEKDPRRSLHLDDVPTPELAPGEALIAVMASSINYNTVWTSIFEPVSTFGFLRAVRPDPRLRQAARPAVPRDRLRRCGRGAAHRPGREGVEAGRQGRRPLPVGGAGVPDGAQRHDDGPRAADLGLRDQLRRPGRARGRQVQPAAAQARAPDVGGGRLPRPGQLHRLPPAGLPQRRRHEAGRRRPDLGRLAAAWAPTPPSTRSTAAPSRSASCPRPEKADLARAMGAELVIDRSAEGYRFWKDAHHPGPEGVAAARQADPRAHRRRRPRHRLRAPRPRDLRRLASTSPARAAPSSPARPPAGSCTSTTTATCG